MKVKCERCGLSLYWHEQDGCSSEEPQPEFTETEESTVIMEADGDFVRIPLLEGGAIYFSSQGMVITPPHRPN